MDIKPGNILIGFDNRWYFCDFGSACSIGDRKSMKGLTPAYIPSDLKRSPNSRFDFVLLVVTAIILIAPKAINISGSFSMADLRDGCKEYLKIPENLALASSLIDETE